MLCDGGRRKKFKEILKIVSLSFVPMVRMRHYSVIDSNYLSSDNCELLHKQKRTISMPNSGKISNSKKLACKTVENEFFLLTFALNETTTKSQKFMFEHFSGIHFEQGNFHKRGKQKVHFTFVRILGKSKKST